MIRHGTEAETLYIAIIHFYHLSPKNPVPTGWLSGGIATRL